MRRLAAALLLCILTLLEASSQSSSLKGSITDSIEKKNLSNTVVALLHKNDSVLMRFTRADVSGSFSMNNLEEGKFIVMITHPYFGDYFDSILIVAGTTVDLGKIFMTPKSKLLAEVILKSGAPIRIKGDTTVYTADSFRVREGANVEELLRRLPGIQVDRNGQITAMGEKVTKVLVDGEEFFGSDPGIATKNLRADIVKEVEVYDKKSDQAEFTGIDDGVKDKTINLKLKDDKKKGYFGKVEVGGGLKDKYNNNIMLNGFKGKRKLAAYAIMSNTGQTNLDWRDEQNYGGGISMEMDVSDDGGMSINFGGDDENNYWGGRNGIPQNWNGGLHYNNKFNNDKRSLNTGYRFSKVNAPALNRTFSKTFLPDTSWTTDTRSNNFSSVKKHAFNLTYDATLDSMNSIKWVTKANNSNSISSGDFFSESLTNEGDPINNSTRNFKNKSDKNNITSTFLWKHKFKKISRTLSVNTDLNWISSKADGFLFSRNNYFINGVFDHRDTTDQQNISDNEAKAITSRLAYTEPLKKDLYMELSYSFAYNGNSNDRVTNIKDLFGKYSSIVDSLSNSFVFNRLVHTPGITFRLNKKKFNLSVGTTVGFNRFIQKNLTENTRTNYNFTNFFPKVFYTYKFKPSQQLRINYNGSSTAPNLEQLQPIRINTDPLNIYIGNQGLKQAFRHSFNLGYNSYNVLKEKNVWANMNFSFTQNAFSQSNRVDSLGRRIYQTVNVNGVYNLDMVVDYGFKIKDSKWRLNFNPRLNMNRNIDIINGVRNSTVNRNLGMQVGTGQYVANKYNFNIGPMFAWNHSKASVNPEANADYWQISGWGSATVTFPHQFELNTDAEIQLRQKDPRFPRNNNYTNWNATALKRFAKDKFELKFGVYDILNQNKGYQRDFNSYSFTESYYTTLSRFWLITFVWNISKNGKPLSDF